MWFRKKKSAEILDLVELQKRGILKQKNQQTTSYIPITSAASNSTSSSTQENTSPFSFLDSLASSASTPTEPTTNNPFINQVQENPSEYPGLSQSQLSELKEQINSVSYKLSRLLDRLEVVEKKIDKHEREIN
jgi:hypothetical protein